MTNEEFLKKLERLHKRGAISQRDYESMKEKVSSVQQEQEKAHSPKAEPSKKTKLEGIGIDGDEFFKAFHEGTKNVSINDWGAAIHLSQLAGLFAVPILGMVVPIVIWQLKKKDSPILDHHGMVVANWILSLCIYSAISFVLIFVLIGIPMFAALVILNLVYIVIGAIKARDGVVWPYPGSIRFFKPESKNF